RRARSGRGSARSDRRDRSAGGAARARRRLGPSPSACPGVPRPRAGPRPSRACGSYRRRAGPDRAANRRWWSRSWILAPGARPRRFRRARMQPTQPRQEFALEDLGPRILRGRRASRLAERVELRGIGDQLPVEADELAWIRGLEYERVASRHGVVLALDPRAREAARGHRLEPDEPERLVVAVREHGVPAVQQHAPALRIDRDLEAGDVRLLGSAAPPDQSSDARRA